MSGDTDSKKLWLSIVDDVPDQTFVLGKQTTHSYLRDPRHLAFVASRYKFVAKLAKDAGTVLEVGCGDAFGAPIVASEVGHLVCADIDEGTLQDNRERLSAFSNISFEYHDFRRGPRPGACDVVYAIDVLEHIYPEEESVFIANLVQGLPERGVGIFGTPNKTSEQYASQYSKIGHVNVKSHAELSATMKRHFHNVFMFGMNDEVVHTGYPPMCHYLWALCVGPKRTGS